MQHAPLPAHSLRWIARGTLALLAGLVAFGVSPALPALAGSWSAPVQLPGSCGSSLAVNRAGAMVAGGTYQAAGGITRVDVCTSPDGKTWQVTDLGPGGDQPHGGQHPVMALSPDGHAVAVWGSTVGCPAACDYIVQAAVRPPGGSWGAPVTLTTDLYFGGGGIVLGMDGAGNAIAAWVGNYADASHYAVLRAGGSWGPVQELSNGNVQGAAHNLSLAVSPDGSAIVAFAGGNDGIWAVSGSVLGGFSAPVFVAPGDYRKTSAPKAALAAAGRIVRRPGRRRSRRHLRLRRQQRQRVHVRGRRHQLRRRQRIARQPGRPEDRPRPGRDAHSRDRISRDRELTSCDLAAGSPGGQSPGNLAAAAGLEQVTGCYFTDLVNPGPRSCRRWTDSPSPPAREPQPFRLRVR